MDIFAVLKCREESFISREKGKYAEFNLRIIGNNERISISSNEAFLDLTSISISCWNILEIWIIGRHSSRRGSKSIISGMNAAVWGN